MEVNTICKVSWHSCKLHTTTVMSPPTANPSPYFTFLTGWNQKKGISWTPKVLFNDARSVPALNYNNYYNAY